MAAPVGPHMPRPGPRGLLTHRRRTPESPDRTVTECRFTHCVRRAAPSLAKLSWSTTRTPLSSTARGVRPVGGAGHDGDGLAIEARDELTATLLEHIPEPADDDLAGSVDFDRAWPPVLAALAACLAERAAELWSVRRHELRTVQSAGDLFQGQLLGGDGW